MARLIIHSKTPQWNDIAETRLDVILHDKSLIGVGNLFLSFVPSANLERLAVNEKTGDWGVEHSVVDTRLVVEESLAQVAFVCRCRDVLVGISAAKITSFCEHQPVLQEKNCKNRGNLR